MRVMQAGPSGTLKCLHRTSLGDQLRREASSVCIM
jgi:hypothetical protein